MTDFTLNLSSIALILAILVALLRMIKGPTVLDRILAFDTIAVCVVGLIIVLSIQWDSPFFLELIIVVSLLGFISGVAFVVYLEKTLGPHPDDADSPATAQHTKPGNPPRP